MRERFYKKISLIVAVIFFVQSTGLPANAEITNTPGKDTLTSQSFLQNAGFTKGLHVSAQAGISPLDLETVKDTLAGVTDPEVRKLAEEAILGESKQGAMKVPGTSEGGISSPTDAEWIYTAQAGAEVSPMQRKFLERKAHEYLRTAGKDGRIVRLRGEGVRLTDLSAVIEKYCRERGVDRETVSADLYSAMNYINGAAVERGMPEDFAFAVVLPVWNETEPMGFSHIGAMNSLSFMALTAVGGRYRYTGSGNNPYTIYMKLDDILAYMGKGDAGRQAFREKIRHECRDAERKLNGEDIRHVDEPADIVQLINDIEREILAGREGQVDSSTVPEILRMRKILRNPDLDTRAYAHAIIKCSLGGSLTFDGVRQLLDAFEEILADSGVDIRARIVAADYMGRATNARPGAPDIFDVKKTTIDALGVLISQPDLTDEGNCRIILNTAACIVKNKPRLRGYIMKMCGDLLRNPEFLSNEACLLIADILIKIIPRTFVDKADESIPMCLARILTRMGLNGKNYKSISEPMVYLAIKRRDMASFIVNLFLKILSTGEDGKLCLRAGYALGIIAHQARRNDLAQNIADSFEKILENPNTHINVCMAIIDTLYHYRNILGVSVIPYIAGILRREDLRIENARNVLKVLRGIGKAVPSYRRAVVDVILGIIQGMGNDKNRIIPQVIRMHLELLGFPSLPSAMKIPGTSEAGMADAEFERIAGNSARVKLDDAGRAELENIFSQVGITFEGIENAINQIELYFADEGQLPRTMHACGRKAADGRLQILVNKEYINPDNIDYHKLAEVIDHEWTEHIAAERLVNSGQLTADRKHGYAARRQKIYFGIDEQGELKLTPYHEWVIGRMTAGQLKAVIDEYETLTAEEKRARGWDEYEELFYRKTKESTQEYGRFMECWSNYFAGGGKRNIINAMVNGLVYAGEIHTDDMKVRLYPDVEDTKGVIGILKAGRRTVLSMRYSKEKGIRTNDIPEDMVCTRAGREYDWEWIEDRFVVSKIITNLSTGTAIKKIGNLKPTYEKFIELLGITQKEETRLRSNLATAAYNCVRKSKTPDEAADIYLTTLGLNKNELTFDLKKQLIIATYNAAMNGKEESLRKVIYGMGERNLAVNDPEILRSILVITSYLVQLPDERINSEIDKFFALFNQQGDILSALRIYSNQLFCEVRRITDRITEQAEAQGEPAGAAKALNGVVAHAEGFKVKGGRDGLWAGGAAMAQGSGINNRKEEIKNQATEEKMTYDIGGKKVYVSKELKEICEQNGAGLDWLEKYLGGQFAENLPTAREVFIDLLDDSEHLFEDCAENGYIGINKKLFEISDSGLIVKLMKLGVGHELKHEAGTLKSENKLLEEDLIASIELGISNEDIEILEKSGILKEGSLFIAQRKERTDELHFRVFMEKLGIQGEQTEKEAQRILDTLSNAYVSSIWDTLNENNNNDNRETLQKLRGAFLRLVVKDKKITKEEVMLLVGYIEEVMRAIDELEGIVTEDNKGDTIKGIALYLCIEHLKGINGGTPKCITELAERAVGNGNNYSRMVEALESLKDEDVHIMDAAFKYLLHYYADKILPFREYLYVRGQLKEKLPKDSNIDLICRYVMEGESAVSDPKVRDSIKRILKIKQLETLRETVKSQMPSFAEIGIAKQRADMENKSAFPMDQLIGKAGGIKILQHLSLYISGNPGWDRENLDDMVLKTIKTLIEKGALKFVYDDEAQKQAFMELLKSKINPDEWELEWDGKPEFISEKDVDLSKDGLLYVVRTENDVPSENNIAKNNKVIVAGKEGVVDLLFTWKITLLVRQAGSDMRPVLRELLKEYYQGADDESRLDALADEMLRGGYTIVLPPVARWVEDYFKAFTISKKLLDIAA